MRLSEIAERINGEVLGDGDYEVSDVADYNTAGPDALSCADSLERLQKPTAAGALVVPPDVDPGRPGIRCDNPVLGFIKAIHIFRPQMLPESGIHPTAQINEGVRIGECVSVGPYASIGNGANIGSGCQIGAGVRIGSGVIMGQKCVIHPNAVLYSCVKLGAYITIHAGAVIGADGFGYVPDEKGGFEKFPQTGSVMIEDGVEIGANTTIDRAALGVTRIGRGTKIDNLVQIGHNVDIGEGCILASQVGISGSVKIGKGAILGGQVGVADHVEIGEGAQIGAQTGITKSIEGGKTYLDSPADEASQVRRRIAVYRKLPELLTRVNKIEEKLKERKT